MKLPHPLALLALTSALIAPTLYAREDGVRIMLKSESAATIEVTGTSSAETVVTKSPKSVSLDQTITADQWTTVSLQFKVSEDADIQLRLSARWTKADDKWVLIDNVKAEGAKIENGDFENGSDSAPGGWKFRKGQTGPASLVTDDKLAASGTRFVKVSHGSAVVQTIHVLGGTDVTLSFSARSATE